MASSCSFVTFLLKYSISGNTVLSTSNSSCVGLSGTFELLESSSSVSDLSEFIRPDESSIFFNLLKVQKQSLWFGLSITSYLFNFSTVSINFHRQYVSQFPLPLDCDWYIKSIQQDTDEEATLGDPE